MTSVDLTGVPTRHRGGGGETRMVPDATPTSYYGHPVIKPPVWKPEVPLYLFTGGLAGGSALLTVGARLAGNDVLARRALLTGLVAVNVSPVLLIKDLGRPERFLNMLRVFKVTSPMSVGSWLLIGSGVMTSAA
ncbi:MAG: NrfD/PsrC family molybdoenzyme membrane anchor subunit, partial [Candidatus Dormiibacterota bacterium]